MSELAKALAAFQAEMPAVRKTNTANVPTKAGGKYTYTYADLADITQAAMPILTKHGLSFTTAPRNTDTGYELAATLLHTSGETLDGGALPLRGGTPQEMGSSLTYMRRYLFGCVTGLVTDEDDDGQIAQTAPPAKRPLPKPSGKPDWQALFHEAQGNPEKLASLRVMARQAKLPDNHPMFGAIDQELANLPVEGVIQ